MLRVILYSLLLLWSLVTASTTDSPTSISTDQTVQNASTSWATTTDQISTLMVNNTNATDYGDTTTWPTSPSSNSTVQTANSSWATTTDQVSTLASVNNTTVSVDATTWPTSPSSNTTVQTTNSSWATTTDQVSTLAWVNSTTVSVGNTTSSTLASSNTSMSQTTNTSWATTTDQISTVTSNTSTPGFVDSTTISTFALSNGSTTDTMSSTTTTDQMSTSVSSLTSPSTTTSSPSTQITSNQTTQTMSSTITSNPTTLAMASNLTSDVTTQTVPSTTSSSMTTQTMSSTKTSDMTTQTAPSTMTSDVTTQTLPSTTTSNMTTQTVASTTSSSMTTQTVQSTTTSDMTTQTVPSTTTSDVTTQTVPSTTTSNMTTQTMSSTTTADQILTNVSSSTSPSTTTGTMPSTTTQTSSDVTTTSTDATTTETFIGVPNATFSPQVIAERNLSVDNSKYEPIFLCIFDEATGYPPLFYNVKWYINTNELQNAYFQTYSFATINHTALRPDKWTGTYSMNMDVKCSVSAQYTTSSTPGSWYMSQNFRAGFTIDTTFLSLNEEESKTITVTSTVPVGCSASYTDADKEANCKGNLHIRTLDWGWCWNGVKYLAAVFPDNGCLLQFSYSNWDQPVHLNITGYVDGMRNWWYRYTRVKFESASDTNTATSIAWNNIDISDTISVYTYDPNSYSGGLAMCGSFNDPHMVTFDRNWYENQRTGEFILYRHKSGKYQVNALYSSCYPMRATCNCGVGIRSGENLYVVRTCLEVSQQRVNLLDFPYEAYDGCSNDDEIVVEKTGSNYRVTLSSGTEISFSLSYWSNWISFIQVVPSATDREKTEGLCGFYNDDSSDDFIPKGGSTDTDERTFALSWRVEIGSNESLFKENPNLSGNTGTDGGSTPTIKYCTCSSYSNVQNNPSYATCNLQAPTEPCSSVTGQTVNTCSSSSRRRRSTTDSDDIIDKPSFSYDPDYDASFEIVNATFFNGWNESYANEFCNKSFTEDPAVTTCIEKVNTSATEYIKGCVDDIKMLGNASFLSATIDTLKKACVTTASRDQSFQNNTDGDGGVSILDLLKSLTCLNNCSQQGTCANETCTCNDGFIGEDCSETLSTPPTSISLPGPMCESNVRACAKTNIAGKFHSNNITANCTHFTSTSDGKVYSGYFVYVSATYRHQNLISVQLPTPPNSRRRKRSTANAVNGWDIQLSYDGVNYGTAVTILVFNSDLSSCDPTTLKCVSKVTGDSNTSDTSDNTAAIAAGVALAVVVVIALIIVVVFVKVNKRGKQRARVSVSDQDMRRLQD